MMGWILYTNLVPLLVGVSITLYYGHKVRQRRK